VVLAALVLLTQLLGQALHMLAAVVEPLTKTQPGLFPGQAVPAAVVAVLQLVGVLELLALPIQVAAVVVEILIQGLAAQAVAA
jgi:hypothetical protein